LWEAEGFPGSNKNLQYDYDWGTVVDDPYASGGKAIRFIGPGTPGLIQWGPSYEQERGAPPIEYTAEFRLKYVLFTPRGAMGGNPGDSLCRIMVVNGGAILNSMKLSRNNFTGAFQTFTLGNYTVPEGNRIEFKIYWFGKSGAFSIDYVKAYDYYGHYLIDLKSADQRIMDYVSQPWVHTPLPDGDTVVYRWYLRDEPSLIDQYRPLAYIDSLLREVSPEREGFQFFCGTWEDTNLVHEYLLRANPRDYAIDIYPTGWCPLCTTFSGPDYQQVWDVYCNFLNRAKTSVVSLDKDLWVAVQAHTVANKVACADTDTCLFQVIEYQGECYCCPENNLKRDPTPNEVRLQTFLALCCGADAIMYYHFPFTRPDGSLHTGLYDAINDSTTCRFREIRDFTGTRARVLGQTIKQLQWQGACSDDSVGSFTLRDGEPSYIDSIRSDNPADEPHWVEVGFFSADSGQYTDYFMLVNRECLGSEAADYDISFTNERGLYCRRAMYTDSIIAMINGSGDQFMVHLEPGEGKLFRLEPRLFSSRVIQVPQDSSCIQCAINGAQDGDTVLVAPGTYMERINFRGKRIVVASYYILLGEQQYISYTRINADHFPLSDSASVVTFKSGEDSNSVLAGFTLLGGSGTMTRDKGGIRCGGGVFCLNSSPTIRNNIIQGNEAINSSPFGCGGGIYCEDYRKTPTISSNLIRSNTSNYGGGIYCSGSSAKIVNNLIIGNSALYVSKDTTLDDGGYGGGIECDNRSRLIIVNNTLDSNYAYIYGGGIDVRGSSFVQVANNIISRSLLGDGIYVYSSNDTAYISYCDFWGNFEDDIDGIVVLGLGDTTWGWNRNETPCDSFYNIFRNPYFVEGYHLADSSACIDAGDNNAPTLPPTDFDGNPRVADGDTNGSFFVDMGAYEYQTGGYGGFAKIVGGDRKDTETRSSSVVPDKFSLLQNYPNPFNPATVVKFEIVQPAKVSLKIYNILGRLVRVLVDEEKVAGTYTTYWDGNDQNGQPVSSGIYFYKLDAGDFTEVKKMVLIK
jgi:hypothetical protein